MKTVLNNGNADWIKTDCSDTSGKGHVCQRRQNVEDVGKKNTISSPIFSLHEI